MIIVGAGPAGSTAAKYVAPGQSGASVLLLEAKRQVGVPIQCGEALPNYADVKLVFPGADCPELFDLPEQVIASEVHGIKFVLPKGRTCFADVTGKMIYRDRLDQFLFERALAVGADYRLNTRVRRIDGHRVITGSEEFVADLIIGSDGPNSLVAASFPVFKPNRVLVPCAFVLAEGDFFERHIEIWIDKRFPGGYFWIFAKNGAANIGVGVRGAKHVRGILEGMLNEMRRSREFVPRMTGGGVVPMSGLKKRVAWEHVALVGDAAGMVFPTNGGGTAQAMLGGQILGETIRQGLPLSEYQRRVDDVMRPVFEQALRIRRVIDLCRCSERLFLALMWMFDRRGWKSFIVG